MFRFKLSFLALFLLFVRLVSVRGQVTLTLQSAIVAVQSFQTLVCRVGTNSSAQFQWLFNDVALDPSHSHAISVKSSGNESKLSIAPIDFSHAGKYECRASFSGSEESDSKTLEVKSQPIAEAETTQYAIVGEDGTITCTSVFASTIFWYFAADPVNQIRSEGRFSIVMEGNRSELTIHNVSESDAASYKCVALNEVGSNDKAINLELLAKPVLQALPNTTLSKGNTFMVACRVQEGKPTPALFWSFKGTNVTSNAVISSSGTVSTLTISSLGFAHAGAYECRAVNRAGTATASTVLIVQGLPEISVSPPNLSEGILKRVQFTCSVVAYPALLTLTWKKNGVELLSGEKYEKTEINATSSVLVVKSVTAGDAGDYTCEARNSKGTSTMSATLQVIEPPPPPTNTLVTSPPTRQTVNISWTPPTSVPTNQAIEQYIVTYRSAGQSAGEVTVPSTQTAVQLVNLHPGVNYTLWVVATNRGGNSNPSNMQQFVTLPSAPSIQELRVSSVNGRVVVLEWVLEYDGGSVITSYVLEYRVNGQDWVMSNDKLNILSGKHCVTGLTPKQDYSFRLKFGNEHGSSEAKIGTITTPIGVPAAPTVPTVSMATGLSVLVKVRFTDLGLGRLETMIVNITGGGVAQSMEFTVNREVQTNEEVEQVVSGLQSGQEYRFSVAGRNAAGLGEFSGQSNPLILEDENLIYYIIAGAVGGVFLFVLLLLCCVVIVICCRRKNHGQFELKPAKTKSPTTIREPLPARSELVTDGQSQTSSRRQRRFSDHVTPFSHDVIPREAPPYPLPPPFLDNRGQSTSNSYVNFKEQLLLEDGMYYDSDWNLKDGSQPDGFVLSQNCSTDV